MSADQLVQPLDRRPDDYAAPAEAIQQDADAPCVGDFGVRYWAAMGLIFSLGCVAGRYWG
jgi:hypothetical protein